MKWIFTSLVLIFSASAIFAQTTADFENYGLTAGDALNGSDGTNSFTSGNISFRNSYNPDFNSWSGWAVTAGTDVTTPGFTNDLSAITGGGYNSTAYAMSYAFSQTFMKLEGPAAGGTVEGMYITNSTYTYLSMLEGDGFAKKFGGETGDDPDFLVLTIKKYLGGELGADSVSFYLADYRFEDNSQDYIIDEWTYVDLTSLGNADSLEFSMNSSDVGGFGMNTPAYFCIDDFTTNDNGPVSTKNALLPSESLSVFPNPTSGTWFADWTISDQAEAVLTNINGQVLETFVLRQGTNTIEALTLPAGLYLLHIQTESGRLTKKLFKTIE
ncbi:MAG: DUF4465 domain-containing protein [Mameliella sp.]|nr:DUF4465 domain-containing protein [Phaeodactylibacter sp.]